VGSFYSSLDAEAAAIYRAAARARCEIRSLEVQVSALGGPARLVGSLSCSDGWAAAALLLALSEEDAATEGARNLARGLRHMAPSDPEFARAVHAFVKARVAFAPELGEVFQSGGLTLDLRVGDCDDHARLVYALAVAGGLRARLGVLHHGEHVDPDKRGPAHATALLDVGGAWRWAETTVAARFGEPPNDAARRLGLQSIRSDIAREVVHMAAKDLAPLPAGFAARNPPERVALDSEALARLGYLAPGLAGICDAADPMLREAVLSFQLAAGISSDGVLGPETRASLASSMAAAGPPVTEGFSYPGLGALSPAFPIEPIHSRDLSDEFLSGIVAMTARFNAKGSRATAEDWARVWYAESGLSAKVPNGGLLHPSGEPYGGLNQMGPSERKAVGFVGNFAQWLGLSEVEQLPFVERYYEAKPLRLIHDARSAYVATFAPAYLPGASNADAVLYRYRPIAGMPAIHASAAEWATYNLTHSDPYAENRGYDWTRKGWITVGDLTVALDRVGGARWDEVKARLRSLGGASSPAAPIAPRLGGAVALLFMVGAVGLLWWTARG